MAIEDPEHRMWRIKHILPDIQLHSASLESFASLFRVVNQVKPDECYHLAALSYVSYSFEDEFSTLNTNINGAHYVLATIKEIVPSCRIYFAGSSEMFGKARETPQNENTPFRPRSAYGISKVAGFDLTRNYREAYQLYACSGILFNHESPRRGYEFVTRKITSHVARIKLGKIDEVRLGNLDAQRDWGHARDYVKAIRLMLKQDQPDDYVVATGKMHSVRDFAQLAFSLVDLNYEDYVKTDPEFFRPTEIDLLLGDPAKALKELGWKAETTFEELVGEMVESDLRLERDCG